jgi:hypothetical protein
MAGSIKQDSQRNKCPKRGMRSPSIACSFPRLMTAAKAQVSVVPGSEPVKIC